MLIKRFGEGVLLLPSRRGWDSLINSLDRFSDDFLAAPFQAVSMRILLDTDICIYLIRRRFPEILRRLTRYRPGDVGISSITLAELAYGVWKSQYPKKNQAALDEFVLPLEIAVFDEAAARTYGEIRAALEKAGAGIGPHNILIGAQALTLPN